MLQTAVGASSAPPSANHDWVPVCGGFVLSLLCIMGLFVPYSASVWLKGMAHNRLYESVPGITISSRVSSEVKKNKSLCVDNIEFV